MRVVHVHRIRGIGGSERHLLTLLPALAARGVDTVFVGLDDPAWDPADFYGALRVPAVRLRAPRDIDPLLLFAYQSACAALFVGATRYRIAWDFLLALLAAAAVERVLKRVRAR